MSEAEITICSVARAVRNRKTIFISTFSIFVLVGFLSSILPQPIYTATVLVVPNSEGDSGGFGNLSTNFAEAGALFGVNLDGADATRREYLAMLRSRSFGVWFIEKLDLMPFLFPERWDSKQGRWKPLKDSFITNFSRRVGALIARISNDRGWRSPSASPSAQEAYERFDKRIRMIKEDRKNGTIAIEFRYSDPVKAAEWANAYVDFANREIRAKKNCGV
ncbi:MAG: hypothetical protein KatS3mg082_2413 [Nitrospiraceae bacterium]|nr:MAG: hypothetical protein KatS3mg082_2413 [Nitrospiraceae bacterium]